MPYFKCESETPKYRDGNHGLRLFIESCDYSVEENFNQNIFGLKGVQAGFTYEDFKVEIDAGRPVLIHFTNHTAIGFGYSNSTRSIRIYTTWSEGPWDMVWGSNLTANGSLAMLSVSIIKLHGSTLKSACMIPTGINDVVNIQNPPSGTVYYLGSWIIPNNTNLMTPCTNASFYAQFQTDYDPRTTACTFDWKLVLYHSGGEYIYAQQNGIVENANTPNSTGEGCVWQPSLSALPAYNWSIDYNGNIYGKVSVVVHKCNGGGDVIDDFEIGVQLYSKIKDITYAVNSTINATCTKLNLTNVGITSPASVTFNCNRLGIAINGTFQAAKGSTLTINK